MRIMRVGSLVPFPLQRGDGGRQRFCCGVVWTRQRSWRRLLRGGASSPAAPRTLTAYKLPTEPLGVIMGGVTLIHAVHALTNYEDALAFIERENLEALFATAKALGLTIPPALLARAHEMI